MQDRKYAFTGKKLIKNCFEGMTVAQLDMPLGQTERTMYLNIVEKHIVIYVS